MKRKHTKINREYNFLKLRWKKGCYKEKQKQKQNYWKMHTYIFLERKETLFTDSSLEWQ